MPLPHHLDLLAFGVILFICVICPLEGRVCTRVRAEKRVKSIQYPGECHNSFEANCGFFSFEKCIFNETVPCVKTRNITVTVYRIVEECCPGYHRNRDRKCIPGRGSASPGDRRNHGPQEHGKHPADLPNSSFKDSVTSGSVGSKGSGHSRSGGSDDDDDDDGFFLGISHGAYAGIICGILFVACVALLTAVHYRKRRLQDEKKATVPADQEAAQRQQMIPMEKLDNNPAAVTT